ncbi:MAG: peptidylprolyl isomerase [Maricaulaceae bacterium]
MKHRISRASLVGGFLAASVCATAPASAQQQSACPPGMTPRTEGSVLQLADANLRDEGIAAVVNGDMISKYDVRQRMGLIIMTTGVNPTPEIVGRIQQQALNSLINERVKLQAGRELFELEVPQEEINADFENLARTNNASVEDICRSLVDFGIDPDTLEDQIRADIAWQIMVSGRYREHVRVSNHQIDQMLQRLAASATEPQYQISEILLSPPPDASDEDIAAGIQDIFQQLENGASFPAVARQYSAAASAINFGDIGWVRGGELRPEIAEAVAVMAPGNISSPIYTPDGIYLIALRDKSDAQNPERVSLMQALVSFSEDASEDEIADLDRDLRRAARGVRNCSEFDEISDASVGATVNDLGFVPPGNLAEPFRIAVDQMQPGDVSQPIRHRNNLVILGLCERSMTAGAELPTREEIENRLISQQLDLIARRWERDLRLAATIDNRLGS